MESFGAINIGLAPASIDFAQRALARGLDPMMRWTWSVESTDVSNDGGIRLNFSSPA